MAHAGREDTRFGDEECLIPNTRLYRSQLDRPIVAPLYRGRQAPGLYFVFWIFDIVIVGRSGPFEGPPHAQWWAAACPI